MVTAPWKTPRNLIELFFCQMLLNQQYMKNGCRKFQDEVFMKELSHRSQTLNLLGTRDILFKHPFLMSPKEPHIGPQTIFFHTQTVFS